MLPFNFEKTTKDMLVKGVNFILLHSCQSLSLTASLTSKLLHTQAQYAADSVRIISLEWSRTIEDSQKKVL